MDECLPQLEKLLEHAGINELPGDSRHRYALRRALLHSAVFESNRQSAKWFQFFTVTSFAMAGGLVVAVVVLSVSVAVPMRGGFSSVSVVEAAGEERSEEEVTELVQNDRHVLPSVQLVDVSEFVSKDSGGKWEVFPLEFRKLEIGN